MIDVDIISISYPKMFWKVLSFAVLIVAILANNKITMSC